MDMLIVSNRLLKFSGTIVKGFSYLYHGIFPKKRFVIPTYSAPRKTAEYGQKIPRVIWQTNYTDKVTLPLYINYLFNKWISPTYAHRFVSEEGRREFIKANYSADVYERYMRIQIGAAQADFWRVLVLQKYGGVYLDLDAHCITSLDNIIASDDREIYLLMKDGSLSNYFIASLSDNPNLEKILRRIIANIDDGVLTNVAEMTGPHVFDDVLSAGKVRTALYRHTCIQGSFTNEYFQYVDKPQGKWTKAQQKLAILKEKA